MIYVNANFNVSYLSCGGKNLGLKAYLGYVTVAALKH
jgi:hypothetical protein